MRAHEDLPFHLSQLGPAILEATQECVQVLNLAGRVVFMNESGRKCLRCHDTHEVLGRFFADFWTGSERVTAEESFRAAASGTAATFAAGCVATDGSFRWLDVRLSPLRDERATTTAVLAIWSDQTAVHTAQKALAEREQRLQRISQMIPAAVYTCDRLGRIDFFNERAAEIWGRTPRLGDEEEKFCGSFRLWLPDGRSLPHAETPMAVALRSGAACRDGEVIIERPDGTKVTARVNIEALLDDEGAISGAINVFQDISELKRIEQERVTSEKVYQTIGESIDYGIWVCDPEGRNIYASNSFLRLVGLTQEQCSEFGWGSVLHPDDLQGTLEAWRACVAGGTLWEREHRFRGVDGEWHYMLARGLPIRDESGKIVCWAGINLDIDAIKKSELALLDADRKKDQFMAMLSHELRNPLAAALNALHLMRLPRTSEQTQEKAREIIDRQFRHLARLVDDLLDVSRITQGKITLQSEPLQAAQIIDNAIEVARPHIDARELELSVEVPRQPVWLRADLTRMAQVVSNLLHNAAKYTPRGGRISVTCTAENGYAVIRVADTGVGISPDVLPRVFDLFTQAHPSLESTQGGLGVGLTLVRSLVQMHGGSVEIFSQGAGKGTEVVLRVPLLQVEGVDLFAPEAAASSAPGTRRVLIVEDNVDSAQSLAVVLRILGNQVEIRHDGRDAIEAAQSFRPDVIILDIGLPHISGIEIAQQLRGSGEFNSTLLIALTGYGLDTDHFRVAGTAFDLGIVKPVDPVALSKMIQERTPLRADNPSRQ